MVAAVTASEASAGYEAVAVVERATAVGMRWEVMLMESAEVVLIEVVLQWDRDCSPRARTQHCRAQHLEMILNDLAR